jgi:hypothetical protein
MRNVYLLLIVSVIASISLAGQEVVIGRGVSFADGSVAPYNLAKPGDTVWIESGVRGHLTIVNFKGRPGEPIVFANLKGQVIISTDHNYGISFGACSHFKLSGRKGKGYEYGIWIARVTNASGMGISAGYKSTDMEFENCEISNIGFAGIMTKTDTPCNDPSTYRDAFTQFNTVIHDCYIHDVGGEGLYIGSSFYRGYYLADCGITVFQPVLVGTRIFNNRIERTGYDGIQVSSAIRDCEIHHNVLIDCSYLMRSGQMSGILIGGGTKAKCFSNKIIDCYATGILVLGKGGTEVYNNLIIRPGKRFLPDDQSQPESGIFLSDKSGDEKTFYGIYNNTISEPKSDGIRIDNTVDFDVFVYNNAIINPGAFGHYENDNTSRTGQDSYLFDTGRLGFYSAQNNFFSLSSESAWFVGYSTDDFHPEAASPLVDNGLSLLHAGVNTDLDGNARPFGAAFDIGAYEFNTAHVIGEVGENQDFFVAEIQINHSNSLNLIIKGSRTMTVRLVLANLLGRIIYKQDNLLLDVGDNHFTLPVVAGEMLVLSIQSEQYHYARKIIIF